MKNIFTATLIAMSQFVYTQTYHLDFGRDTGIITCNVPYTGTTIYRGCDTIIPQTNLYDARFITSNLRFSDYTPQVCQFVVANPGDTSIGTESELQFVHGHYPDLRFQVTDFVTSTFFRLSFSIKINKPSALHWSYPNLTFYFGDSRSAFFDKTKTPNFYNSPHPTDTMVFGAIHFRSDGLLPNYYNAVGLMYGPNPYSPSIYHTWTPRLIEQGISHRVEVFANTATESTEYQSPVGVQTLLGRHYDVYVDGVQVHTSMGSVHYQGSDVSAFSWFVNQPNFRSPIIIDDIEWSVDGMATALPVKLSRFDASVCVADKRTVCLSWRTESEINNDWFVVEKSTNATDFVPIGAVAGLGTSYVPHEYAFVDDEYSAGVVYYRLRQIDFDGAYEHSPVRSVRVTESDALCDVPTDRNDPAQEYVVHDMFGRVVVSARGIERASLPRGMYVVSVWRDDTLMCRQKVWLE